MDGNIILSSILFLTSKEFEIILRLEIKRSISGSKWMDIEHSRSTTQNCRVWIHCIHNRFEHNFFLCTNGLRISNIVLPINNLYNQNLNRPFTCGLIMINYNFKMYAAPWALLRNNLLPQINGKNWAKMKWNIMITVLILDFAKTLKKK